MLGFKTIVDQWERQWFKSSPPENGALKMGTQSKVKRRVSKAFIHEHRWVIPKRYFVMNFLVTAGAVWLVLMLAGCGPGLTEVLEKGFKCKATITIPEGAREGDVIEVEVEIYNCIELERKMRMSRFDYIKYDEVAQEKQKMFKGDFETTEISIEQTLPDGRAKALAITHLEIAYMWIGKSIRDEQVARTGKSEEVPERGE